MEKNLILILLTVIIIYGMYLFYNIKYIVPLKEKELDNKKMDLFQDQINVLKNSINYDKEFELRYKETLESLDIKRRELRTETTINKIIKDITEFTSSILTNYVMPIYDNKPMNFSEFPGIEGSIIYPLTISKQRRENDIINIMHQIDSKITEIQKRDITELWMPYESAKAYIRDSIITPNYDLLISSILTKLNEEARDNRIETQENDKTDINEILQNSIDKEYYDKFASRK